jgi:ceramide glucosyltransferase
LSLVIAALAAFPLIYYLLVLYSAARFRSAARRRWRLSDRSQDFARPISCLKPVRGLDPDAYENYASFCRQDYAGAYEILFCVDEGDPAVPVIEQIVRDFPDRRIRVLVGSGREGANDKVARLVRLVDEAEHDLFVITDSDVRVASDYLRSVVAPFQDPRVGAATCLYRSTAETTLVQELQSIGMVTDFFAGILVAWQLDDVTFTFGQTIVVTRERLAGFGGYRAIENRPADDLLVGRLVAGQGYRVELLPYVVQTVADFDSLTDLLHKRVRWMTVMRSMRPWGHLGLVFTWGLPWSLVALAAHPRDGIGLAFVAGYFVLRLAVAWTVDAAVGASSTSAVGTTGAGTLDPLWRKLLLIPLWDLLAFGIWLASFGRRTIRWRGVDYLIHGGMLHAPEARVVVSRCDDRPAAGARREAPE